MEEIVASTGYYLAYFAVHIVAHQDSLVDSSGLIEKLGVNVTHYKSGI